MQAPQLASAALVVDPVQPRFGAEIAGIDLRQPLAPALRTQLRELLLTYKVLFFRDQDISREQHLAFAREFGELESHPVGTVEGYPELVFLDSKYERAAIWHTDTSWRVKPSMGAVLRILVLPEVGGDTIWADGEAAYERLPGDLKEQIDELYAVHDAGNIGRNHVKGTAEYEDRRRRLRENRRTHPLVAHPLVRSHPETGRKTLYINPALVSCIVGMSVEQSAILLDRLLAEMLLPENLLRFRWRRHSIAMWDNRNTLHYGVTDYGDAPRLVERATIAGDDIPHR